MYLLPDLYPDCIFLSESFVWSSELFLISSRHFAQKCSNVALSNDYQIYLFFFLFFSILFASNPSRRRLEDTFDSLLRLILVEIRVSGIRGWRSERACFRCRRSFHGRRVRYTWCKNYTWSKYMYIYVHAEHTYTHDKHVYTTLARHVCMYHYCITA